MVKFKEFEWESEQRITVDKLNSMLFNDIFINNEYIEGRIHNVAHDGSKRSPRWITNHLVFFTRMVEVTPNKWKSDADGWSYFEGSYSFPGNNFFKNKYKPIVVVTPKGPRVYAQSITLTKISADGFEYIYYVMDDEDVSKRDDFYMTIFAIGIKPEEDNDLDNENDPSP